MIEQRPAARILIAYDHLLLADGCKSMLEPEFAIVGIVPNGRNLMDVTSALKPDIVIVDSGLSLLKGLHTGGQIKHTLPAIKLMFITADLNADVVDEAFRRGASACVPRQAKGEELLLAIRRVNRGEFYGFPVISRHTASPVVDGNETVQSTITRRETEVLYLLALGMSMKEVAYHIDVKPSTVAFHKYRMMERLNIKTSAELIGYALKRQKLFG